MARMESAAESRKPDMYRTSTGHVPSKHPSSTLQVPDKLKPIKFSESLF